MTTSTVVSEHVDLSSITAWCDAAFASADGSQTVGHIAAGERLYESFGGAIAGIGGQVAQAATAQQEAAAAAMVAVQAWAESVTTLKRTAEQAIGG